MIKHLLLQFTALVLISSGLFGQDLVLSTEEEGELEDGQVITVTGSPDDDLITARIDVTYTGPDSLSVRVRRVENNLVEGTTNYFCWGLCYTPMVDTSSRIITIQSGETSSEFYGDYQPKGNAGSSSITYYFYNPENPNQEVGVEVHYKAEASTPASIELSTEQHGMLEDGEMITINGTVDSSLLISYITVHNTGQDTLDILACRIENSIVENSVNYFCWGSCYLPSVDTAGTSVKIAPGESSDQFSGEYEPHEQSGTSSITYCFFEKGNPDNQVTVEVQYKVSSSGIRDVSKYISSLHTYPVPADGQLFVDYEFKESAIASYRLSNMAGAAVRQGTIQTQSGKLLIKTDNLQNGMYLLTIMMNNLPVSTQKVIVSH